MDKFNQNQNWMKTWQKVGFQLDHIWVIILQNECKYDVTNIFVRFSQIDLYYIQITKHTSNV
jgi:hypothetical protein